MAIVSTVTDRGAAPDGFWSLPVAGDKLGTDTTCRHTSISLVGALREDLAPSRRRMLGLRVRPDRSIGCCTSILEVPEPQHSPERRYASVAELVERGLSPEQRAAFGFAPWQLAMASELELASSLVASGRDTDAREVAYGALMRGIEQGRSLPGHGAVPRLLTQGRQGEALVFYLAAALLVAQPARALVVAADGLASLVERVLRSDPRAAAARDVERRRRVRPPSRVDAFFSSTEPRAVIEAIEQLMSAEGDDRSYGLVHDRKEPLYRFGNGGLSGEDVFGAGQDVESGSRDLRLGHLHVDGGYLHPALLPVVASILGRDAHDLRIADPTAVRAELAQRGAIELGGRSFEATRLILEDVPVIPPAERCEALMVPEPADVLAAQDLVFLEPDGAYRSFLACQESLASYLELGAPEILVTQRRIERAAALDSLLRAVRESPPIPADGWPVASWQPGPVSLPGRFPWGEPDESEDADGEGPPETWKVLWVDDGHLLVQRARAATLVDVETGDHSETFSLDGLDLQSCTTGGTVVLVRGSVTFDGTEEEEEGGEPEAERPALHSGFAAFDRKAKQWLEVLPENIPAVVHAKHQPEDCTLYELSRGVALAPSGGDRPNVAAYAEGNEYLLTCSSSSPRAWSCRSGFVVLDLELIRGSAWETHAPVVRVLARDVEHEDDDDPWADPPSALVRKPDGGWLILADDGWIGTEAGTVARLETAALAAAFDSGGKRLALVAPGCVAIVDTKTWTVVKELDVSMLPNE